jgi:hypothetical protein
MKEQLIKLLKEIIEAGKDTENNLDMFNWYCGTSCCLCGDWALYKSNKGNIENRAMYLSQELDDLMNQFLNSTGLVNKRVDAESVWGQYARDRYISAEDLNIFSEKELEHEHLTLDHSDRDIAHDFILVLIKRLEEL